MNENWKAIFFFPRIMEMNLKDFVLTLRKVVDKLDGQPLTDVCPSWWQWLRNLHLFHLTGICLNPRPVRILKKECCCSSGAAWGINCDRCPPISSREYCLVYKFCPFLSFVMTNMLSCVVSPYGQSNYIDSRVVIPHLKMIEDVGRRIYWQKKATSVNKLKEWKNIEAG